MACADIDQDGLVEIAIRLFGFFYFLFWFLIVCFCAVLLILRCKRMFSTQMAAISQDGQDTTPTQGLKTTIREERTDKVKNN
jgi:hypothetical protein